MQTSKNKKKKVEHSEGRTKKREGKNYDIAKVGNEHKDESTSSDNIN